MSKRRADGLVRLHCAVRPDWKRALQEFAEYSHTTMTHIVVDTVSRRMKRARVWPPETAEEQAERGRHERAREKELKAERSSKSKARRKDAAKGDGASPPSPPREGRRIASGPKDGKPIGGDSAGGDIGLRKRGGYTP